MLTRKEIVLETIEYYKDPKNRAIVTDDEGRNFCQYRSYDGRMCAVGRCMKKSILNKYAKVQKTINSLVYLETSLHLGVDKLLKPQYHGQTSEFWGKLQELHDEDFYWSNDGITQDGINFIKEEIGEDING